MRVLIVGGGIGGPCLAQGLRKAGIECVLFEREPESGRAGYRLHMNADGGSALRQCLPDNLYELYLETSRVNPRRELAVMIDDQLNERSARPHIGPPNLGARPHTAVNRKTLRQILLCGLDGIVQYERVAIGFEEQGDKVQLIFEDGSRETGDVLVGADGIGSTVRRQRLPATLPIDDGKRSLYGRTLLSAAEVAALPDVLHDGFVAATDGSTAFIGLGLFKPRRELMRAAAELAPELQLEPVPDYLMVAYTWIGKPPLDDAALFTASGATLAALMAEGVRAWHPALRDLISRVDPGTCFPQAMRRLPLTPEWAPSRVTLLGDAIHGMPPSFGAGANTALWDAALLTQQLTAAARGERSPVEAIATYEAAMRAHVFPILEASSSMAPKPGEQDAFEEMPRGLERERAQSLVGRWSLVLKTPFGQQKLSAVVVQGSAGLSGTLANDNGPVPLRAARCEDGEAWFEGTLPTPFGELDLRFQGLMHDNKIFGRCQTTFGLSDFSGTRE